MTLQRQVSPIPPGRYWMQIDGVDNIRDFNAWVRDMHGAVQIETASLDEPTHFEASQGVRVSQFAIFVVPEGRAPFLNALQFGFPNVAPSNVTSVHDVTSVQPGKDPLDVATDVVRTAEEAATSAAAAARSLAPVLPLALLLFLAWLVADHMRSTRSSRAAA